MPLTVRPLSLSDFTARSTLLCFLLLNITLAPSSASRWAIAKPILEQTTQLVRKIEEFTQVIIFYEKRIFCGFSCILTYTFLLITFAKSFDGDDGRLHSDAVAEIIFINS